MTCVYEGAVPATRRLCYHLCPFFVWLLGLSAGCRMDLSPEKTALGFGADPDKVMDPGFFFHHLEDCKIGMGCFFTFSFIPQRIMHRTS